MIIDPCFYDSLCSVQESAVDANLTVSQWAEQYRYIKKPNFNVFTLFSFDDSPYLREICDHTSPLSPCKELTLMKGTRIGATLGVILNSQFYNISVNPCQMMYVSSNQKLLAKFKRLVFDPELKASGLDVKIKTSVEKKNSKNKSNGDTAEMIEFGDAYLLFCGANNPQNFRQMSVQYLYKDEEASYKIDKHEGNISKLADARTYAFGDHAKRIGISSPINTGDQFCKSFEGY